MVKGNGCEGKRVVGRSE